MNEPILELKAISKRYEGILVLKGVSFEVGAGEIHGLVGENGAGKSTLMNILFGMPVIQETGGYEGEVRLGGRAVHFGSPKEAMADGVGMVHQEFMLLPGFTIAENIKLNREPTRRGPLSWLGGRRLESLDRERMGRESRAALDRVGLGIDEWLPVAGLPVGPMQFVEIAREVDRGTAKLVIFDEPTAVLTEQEAQAMLRVMQELARGGLGILFITHRLDEVLQISARVTVLRDGEVVRTLAASEGTAPLLAEMMVGRPPLLSPLIRHRGTGGRRGAAGHEARPQEGHDRGEKERSVHPPAGGSTPRPQVERVDGELSLSADRIDHQGPAALPDEREHPKGSPPWDLRERAPDSSEARGASEVILEVRELAVAMPGERVEGVSLDVRRGEIVGIAGLAGHGKVGIANGIMGLFPATGSVRVEGRALPLGDPLAAIRAGLAFVSEDRRGVGLLLDESIELNVAMTALAAKGRFLRPFPLPGLRLMDQRAVRAHALEMIRSFDIRASGPKQQVRRLSGGNQQKVCLARATTQEPGILLVSEPTRGIDVGAKERVLRVLTDLNASGVTLVITSSELAELRAICDRIAVVHAGRLAAWLAPDAPDAAFGLAMAGVPA